MSLPTEPTTAEPGTWQKIEVLARRLELGQELWHPADPNNFDAKPMVPWAVPRMAVVLEATTRE